MAAGPKKEDACEGVGDKAVSPVPRPRTCGPGVDPLKVKRCAKRTLSLPPGPVLQLKLGVPPTLSSTLPSPQLPLKALPPPPLPLKWALPQPLLPLKGARGQPLPPPPPLLAGALAELPREGPPQAAAIAATTAAEADVIPPPIAGPTGSVGTGTGEADGCPGVENDSALGGPLGALPLQPRLTCTGDWFLDEKLELDKDGLTGRENRPCGVNVGARPGDGCELWRTGIGEGVGTGCWNCCLTARPGPGLCDPGT